MTTIIEHNLSTKIINIFMILNVCYIFEKFYELIIDIDIFEYSKIGYEQLLTY